MRNYVQDEDKLVVIAPYAVTSGQGLQVGGLFGVAEGTAAISTSVNAVITGVFDLTKLAGTAWTVGAPIYWDNAARHATVVVGSNKLIGYAAQAQLSGDTVGRVIVMGI